MKPEREPTAFGDLRGWIAALEIGWRDPRNCRRSGLEYRTRHDHAPCAGGGRWTGAALQQHQGLQPAGQPMPPRLRLRAVELSPRGDDAGDARRYPPARTGEAWANAAERAHSAKDRRHRTGEGKHRHRERRSTLRNSRRRSGIAWMAAATSSPMPESSPRIR